MSSSWLVRLAITNRCLKYVETNEISPQVFCFLVCFMFMGYWMWREIHLYPLLSYVEIENGWWQKSSIASEYFHFTGPQYLYNLMMNFNCQTDWANQHTASVCLWQYFQTRSRQVGRRPTPHMGGSLSELRPGWRMRKGTGKPTGFQRFLSSCFPIPAGHSSSTILYPKRKKPPSIVTGNYRMKLGLQLSWISFSSDWFFLF